MPEEKKGLWEISIATKSMLLRTVVTHDSLENFSLGLPSMGPREGLMFEYIIREKGLDPSDIRSIEIKTLEVS